MKKLVDFWFNPVMFFPLCSYFLMVSALLIWFAPVIGTVALCLCSVITLMLGSWSEKEVNVSNEGREGFPS